MATPVEQIQLLMQELGPVMPEIDAIVQTEEPSWAIQFSDEHILVIEPADEPPRLAMSSELGAAPDGTEKPLYEAMLSYNLMWRDSGGLKVGLAGPKGSLIISWEISLDGMTLVELQAAIARFMKAVASWQRYVARADVEQVALPGMGAGGFHLHA